MARRPATLVDWIAASDPLTTVDAARLAGYAVDVIERMIDAGAVDAVDVDGQRMIDKQSLREFLDLLYDDTGASD